MQEWFGLALPGPVTGQVLDFSRRDLPIIGPPETSGAAELSGSRLHGYVDDVCAFSDLSRRKGERLWGRLAGGEAAERTVDFVTQHFRAAGITSVQPVQIPFTRLLHPADWAVTLLGDTALTEATHVTLASAVPMEGHGAVDRAGGGLTPDLSAAHQDQPLAAHVRGPVVYVDDASPVAIATRAVAGRIAVLALRPQPASFYGQLAERVAALIAAGATGVVAIHHLPGNMQTVAGLSPPDTPCFTVGGRDGAFLLAVLEKAARLGVMDSVRLDMNVRYEPARSLTARAVLGKLEGRTTTKKAILVSAHSDSFFTGANDNATGVAALIALARHYGGGPRPDHDLYFYLSPGHHHGTGGMRELASLIPDIASRVQLAINLEHISQAAIYPSYMNRVSDDYGGSDYELMPTGWDSPGRELTLSNGSAALRQVIAQAAAQTMYTAPARISEPAIAEPAHLAALGVACLQGVETGPWFHTSGDEPCTVTPEGLQRAVHFYRMIIDMCATGALDRS
ncbi:M28 family peptidase [Mycolicibacterium sp. CBM1]